MQLSGATLAALVVLTAAAALWLSRAVRRRRARRRQLRARHAEHRAEALLGGLGYRVLERQPRRRWTLEADGERTSVELRADLLVARRGRRYVAEVKSGERAPCLSTPATRRQLLEYGLAYDVDGTLLVDMERGTVQRVRFPAATAPRVRTLPLIALGAALGALLSRLL